MSGILPWCQQCHPSCRCACMSTGELVLWSKCSQLMSYFAQLLTMILGCMKPNILHTANNKGMHLRWCLTLKATLYICTYHACGTACWTCTWSPSSCLWCSSWCLITERKNKKPTPVSHDRSWFSSIVNIFSYVLNEWISIFINHRQTAVWFSVLQQGHYGKSSIRLQWQHINATRPYCHTSWSEAQWFNNTLRVHDKNCEVYP